MKIVIEIDSVSELAQILSWRDSLRDRIKDLEATPVKFSLQSLARDVVSAPPAASLTPDQKEKIRALIEMG